MPNEYKADFLAKIEKRFGRARKITKSLSLFDLPNKAARVYIRYSKVHNNKKSFYGLRQKDLKQLEGLNSFICFIWDTQREPLFVPYSEFEPTFAECSPASDGQYKIQIFHQPDQTEIYIATAGRFNVESFFGWKFLEEKIDTASIKIIPDFTHSQIQTLIGGIGITKGFDVWIPPTDRNKLDWNISERYGCTDSLPLRYEKVNNIIKEIDVIWVNRGSSDLQALFEVEHSTPIYSGLLRFNDLHLVEPNLQPRFSIVSNYIRRALFHRQVNRHTFKISGLAKICNFLEYRDVYGWFKRTKK